MVILGSRGSELGVTIVERPDDQPRFVRAFDAAMMVWYHERGMHTDVSAEELVGKYPTFVLTFAGFTLVLQSGGEKYSGSFSLDVFNERGQIVDAAIYRDGKPEEEFSERWPHGARVVDARKAMEFVPLNPEHPPFVPPQQ